MKESYDRFVTARSNFASHFLLATDLQSAQIRFVGCCYKPKQTRFGTNSGNKMGAS
jgi:hypothetical protein